MSWFNRGSWFAVYMPHQNLGCLGIKLGTFYADLYFMDGSPRLYVNWFQRAKYTLGCWYVYNRLGRRVAA